MCDQCPSSPLETESNLARRNFLKLAGAAAIGMAFGGEAMAAAAKTLPKPQNAVTPDEALARLIKGNKRYINGTSKPQDFASERAALALGQNPFAGVLSCADSRVAPELAFDTGRGDLFVCRVAGNFANDDSIASFEFGVAVLGVPLIVVLGHGSCGAVDSTISAVKDGVQFPGHIPSLVRALRPAVKESLDKPGNLLDNATKANVIRSVGILKSSSPILDKAVKGGSLRILGAVYDLHSGKVEYVAS